jgi:hypothetical protein
LSFLTKADEQIQTIETLSSHHATCKEAFSSLSSHCNGQLAFNICIVGQLLLFNRKNGLAGSKFAPF